MHSNMYSCVMYKGNFPDCFPVLQSTKQGEVWSPFVYSLIEQLSSSNLSFQIEGSCLQAPSFADDMALLSLQSNALQEWINIACLWRYQYNSVKCAVVTFNELKFKYHLCIVCNKYSKTSLIIKQIDRKLRWVFFRLTKDGLHIHVLNPLTDYNIYKSIVIPRSLFGCELIQSLSDRDMLTIERSHINCLRQIKGLQIRTRTHIVLRQICALPIAAEIENS